MNSLCKHYSLLLSGHAFPCRMDCSPSSCESKRAIHSSSFSLGDFFYSSRKSNCTPPPFSLSPQPWYLVYSMLARIKTLSCELQLAMLASMNMSVNRCLSEKTNPLQRVTWHLSWWGKEQWLPTSGIPNAAISTSDLHDIFLVYCTRS